MKKKKCVKWGRVLVGVFFLMIVIGGIVVISKKVFFKEQEAVSSEKEKELEKEENTSSGNDTDEMSAHLEKAPSNSSEFLTLGDGEYLTEKGYTIVVQDGVARVDGNLIVNKTYSVPQDYQPTDPGEAVSGERCMNCLEKEVMSAFRLMQSDATSLGLNIYIASGYRSYTYQERLYNNYTAVSGMNQADTYSARPGHSEHQTGLCFDLNSVEDSFAFTDEGKWIEANAYLYGFIIRYPKGKDSITGYKYESWHLRYVGKELAKKLYNDGDWITMEEYYGLSSSY